MMVGTLARGYAMSGSDIGISNLKCIARHCQRSARTLLISHKSVRKGVGVNTPLELDILQKLYYMREGD